MPNKLSNEQSPYLLQHKDNPVDWYPWGDEAFELAKKENKPVFLSIGYATCHWCHVMAHESFEDESIAALMNEAFVNIKVDREERPDIDQTYMAVCQMLTGHGGWPLTIIMTPDKKPFFAATYIPKDTRFERMGMRQLVPALSHTWNNEQEKIARAVHSIKDGFQKLQVFEAGKFPGIEHIQKTYTQLSASYDPQYGGIGNAPKFPTPHNLIFLLHYAAHNKDTDALHMVTHTLKNMRKGGIFDHIGYGFHRYSTDRMWLLPHFEKMLYDQALLVLAYTEAYQITGDTFFKQTAYEILEYVSRDLTSSEGGFYSAEDADSEGEEGKFYTWSVEELASLLDDQEYALALSFFHLSEEGNFEDEATKKRTGTNILHTPLLVSEYASKHGLSESQLKEKLSHIRNVLFSNREQRIRPLLDDKVLTDWNALMITALAKASFVFNDQKLFTSANTALEFLEQKLVKNDVLYHRYRNGDMAIEGFADDYAFLIWALIELYQASFDATYLAKAIYWNKTFIEKFWDNKDGGFFFSSQTEHESLLGNQKHTYDGAIPAANSVAMNNLIRLSKLTGDTSLLEKANQMGELFSMHLNNYGGNHSQAMQAVQLVHYTSHEIVVADNGTDGEMYINELRKKYLPNSVILKRPDTQYDLILDLCPFLKNQIVVDGKTTVYICENFVCNKPVTSIEELNAAL